MTADWQAKAAPQPIAPAAMIGFLGVVAARHSRFGCRARPGPTMSLDPCVEGWKGKGAFVHAGDGRVCVADDRSAASAAVTRGLGGGAKPTSAIAGGSVGMFEHADGGLGASPPIRLFGEDRHCLRGPIDGDGFAGPSQIGEAGLSLRVSHRPWQQGP